RNSELLAILGVANRIVERGSGVADLRRGNTQPLIFEMFANVLPSLAHLSEERILRYPQVVHEELGRAQTLANDSIHLLDLEPRRGIGYQEHAEPVVTSGAGAREDRDRRIRQVRPGAPHLVAIEHPVFTLEPRSGARGCRI